MTTLEPTALGALGRLGILESIADLPEQFLERLRDGAAHSQAFQQSAMLSTRLEQLLKNRGVTPTPAQGPEPETDDQIPF